MANAYHLLSVTLSLFTISTVQSQTGEGCYNKYTPCPEPGQVRINAILHPSTGAFIGGCYCGCDYESMYNPLSAQYCPLPKTINYDPISLSGDCSCNCRLGSPLPSDCQLPHVFNDLTCECACPSDGSECALHQIFNPHTCECECHQLGVPGQECFDLYTGAIPDSQVLPDCTCQCPPHSPQQSDCAALGREWNLCKCGCPMETCPGNQVLNHEMCSCACAECPLGEILLNEVTCGCASVGQDFSINGPIYSNNDRYCCQPVITGFVPFYGRCWGNTDDYQCEYGQQQYGMCKWDIYNCHPEKPKCFFRDYVCSDGGQCCSGVCRVGGLCR